MIDIRFLRENSNLVKADLEKRQDKTKQKWIDLVLKLDQQYRKLKTESDSLRSRRNKASQEINLLKKQGKNASAVIKEVKEIPVKIAKIGEDMDKVMSEIKKYLMQIPNITHKSVPYGKDESANKTVKKYGTKPKFDFDLLGHVELLEKHPDWADLERAAKISGARWYFLKNDLALLEIALERYAIDFMMARGYSLTIPPFFMNKKSYEGVTSMDAFSEALYKVEGEDLYAIATAEHPLTAQFSGEVFAEDKLPVRLVGASSCFRKEAGSHGKDTKGIFRVHQFKKVEQVIICKPEDSWKLHEEIIGNSIEFFESLGLHFRQVILCTGDTGLVSAKTYDLEVWYPSQKEYRELVSGSNCTNYQAVRLGIRYQHSSGRSYVHTLNATCVSIARALTVIIENFQNKDGSVNIPKVLQKYMNGMKVIGKVVKTKK